MQDGTIHQTFVTSSRLYQYFKLCFLVLLRLVPPRTETPASVLWFGQKGSTMSKMKDIVESPDRHKEYKRKLENWEMIGNTSNR